MRLWDTFVAENADLFGTVTPESVNFHANVSLQHRYLYYETPKVACSSVMVTLSRFETEDESLTFDLHEVHAISPLLSPVQVASSFKRLRDDAGFFAFAFVRNPFTRLLSAYLDKIRGRMPHKRIILRQLGRYDGTLAGEVTFAEFVDAVAAEPVQIMDPHWKVQHHHLLRGRLRFDAIGRFERFDEDFAAIGRRLHPDFARYVQRDTRHATGAGAALRDHYDARLVEVVRRVYAEDFDGFGYERDLPTGGPEAS
jgi:hypothetical protein